MKTLPTNILGSICALLVPYCPEGVTPDAISDALRGCGNGNGTAASGGGHMLTIDQTAERLQISPRTTRRLITSGELQSIRLSERCVRVPEQALIDLAAGKAGIESDDPR